jgi:hypothetical protein
MQFERENPQKSRRTPTHPTEQLVEKTRGGAQQGRDLNPGKQVRLSFRSSQDRSRTES